MMHIPGLIHRLSLLQNELSVPSSTQLHCSKGRNIGWYLLKCPRHFIHRLTLSKVGLKILQKSGLFSVAMHCILLVLFSHIPQSYPHASGQQAATTCRSEESLKSTLQYFFAGKESSVIWGQLNTNLSHQWLHEKEQTTSDICSLKPHQPTSWYNP